MNVMDLAGVHAPIPTPFDGGGAVDLEKFKTLFARWLKTPLAGFVVLGSTGEAVLLDDKESAAVIAAVRDLVPRDRHFIVGTGRESTGAAVKAARRAAGLGADAVLVRTPGFFKPQMTTDALVRHYTSVADESPIPVLLYNFMAMTGVNLQADAVAILSRHPNVIGVKESGGDVGQIADLVAGTPREFQVLAGSAGTFLPALSVGARGGILALACVLPEACCRLYVLARDGRRNEALNLQQQLLGIARLIGTKYGVPALKAAMQVVGADAGLPRPPLMPVPDAVGRTLRDVLATFEEVVHESPA
jgi:4-hydroxy-2-oxoglutarate aldolase